MSDGMSRSEAEELAKRIARADREEFEADQRMRFDEMLSRTRGRVERMTEADLNIDVEVEPDVGKRVRDLSEDEFAKACVESDFG
jgi:hypothetical protein